MNRLFLYFVLIFTLASCSNDVVEIPDVEHINLENQMVRFDKMLMGENNFVSQQSIDAVMESHPVFSKMYFGPILHLIGQNNIDFIAEDVQRFTTDPYVRHVQDTIDQTFDQFDKHSKELTLSLKLLKYYFPEYPTPSVYYANTLFNYQAFIFNDNGRDGIGIGLDMFCNELIDYKAIDPSNSAFSQYLSRSFNPDHLSKKILDLALDEICGVAPGVRMIDLMIHNGKRHYIMDHLLPHVNDTIVIEYSQDQMVWVKDNELEMWSFYLEEELFYETSVTKISKYVNPSPSAPGMPSEAPGRTANYMGWQIVKSYMSKFPETTLQDLIALNDAQKILEDSGYRPKRKG